MPAKGLRFSRLRFEDPTVEAAFVDHYFEHSLLFARLVIVLGAVPGAGFINMSDRLGTVEGTLRVTASVGRGGRVQGWVPVGEEAAGAASPGELSA